MVDRRAAILVALLGALGAAYACGIYDTSLLLPAVDAGAGDAGDAVAMDAQAGDGGDSCVHARVRPKPTSEDGTEDLDLTMAVNHIRLLPSGPVVAHPPRPVGFDLDSVCTCPGPESCTPIGASSKHCDGEGGTDDSVGSIFLTFSVIAADKFSDEALNANIYAGLGTVLVRVRSYNGGKDDKQVTVIVYVSDGLQGIQDGGTPPNVPKVDGTDVWTINPSSLLGGGSVDSGVGCEGNDNVCVPLFADTEAYVADGILVAHVDFPISVGTSGQLIVLTVSDTALTGALVKDDAGRYGIDEGQVAGRWNTSEFLTAMAAVKDPLKPAQSLCGDSGTYLNIKDIACKGSDLMTHAADDNTGVTCDALSIAMAFSSFSAHLGPAFFARPATNTCGADWKADCTGVK